MWSPSSTSSRAARLAWGLRFAWHQRPNTSRSPSRTTRTVVDSSGASPSRGVMSTNAPATGASAHARSSSTPSTRTGLVASVTARDGRSAAQHIPGRHSDNTKAAARPGERIAGVSGIVRRPSTRSDAPLEGVMSLDLFASLFATLAAPALVLVGPGRAPSPLAHTYSIVARDPKTGEMGVAVQSHYFSVGPIVPWAEAGV